MITSDVSYEEVTRRTWRHTEGGLSDRSSLLRSTGLSALAELQLAGA